MQIKQKYNGHGAGFLFIAHIFGYLMTKERNTMKHLYLKIPQTGKTYYLLQHPQNIKICIVKSFSLPIC